MKYQAPKTVLCIHDLSTLGRCSTAVIAPVLSVMGHQPAALPTAILSTHTGFGSPAVQDCQAFGPMALRHYQRLGVEFDCIYSGYLAGAQNQQLVKEAFKLWPSALKVVDPVLGDKGRLYSGMEGMLEGMRELCRMADIIVPNLTEAALLTGCAYPAADPTEEELAALKEGLCGICPQALITGVPMGRDLVSVGCGKQEFIVRKQALNRSYPGTGDLFGAVLTGSLLRGNALSAAADAAAGFVVDAIRHTDPGSDPAYGVWFEPILSKLCGGGM